MVVAGSGEAPPGAEGAGGGVVELCGLEGTGGVLAAGDEHIPGVEQGRGVEGPGGSQAAGGDGRAGPGRNGGHGEHGGVASDGVAVGIGDLHREAAAAVGEDGGRGRVGGGGRTGNGHAALQPLVAQGPRAGGRDAEERGLAHQDRQVGRMAGDGEGGPADRDAEAGRGAARGVGPGHRVGGRAGGHGGRARDDAGLGVQAEARGQRGADPVGIDGPAGGGGAVRGDGDASHVAGGVGGVGQRGGSLDDILAAQAQQGQGEDRHSEHQP